MDDLAGDVLIVDDLIDNLRLLDGLLREAGYRVRGVTNGPAALAAAFIQPPEIILLDARMPGMDGYEVCRQLKEDVRTSSIPVLFLSALRDSGDRVRGFDLGAVDFLSKPIQRDELLARVRTHVSLERLRTAEREQRLRAEALLEQSQARAAELEKALSRIRRLEGIIPICMHCHRIRQETNEWQRLEQYISENSDAVFSHGVCPGCYQKHYGELLESQGP